MGLGCNACGVMGCRIIQSPRERLIAILTNAFIPCNGRLPTLTALIAMFFVTGSGLWSSIAVAAPAGLLIWIAANVTVGGESVLLHLANFLQPLGGLMGLDGIILLAFFLGFPANEIVVPCMLMGYLSTGTLTDYGSLSQLHGLLTAHGWTTATAVCALVFTLFHFPCGTTCFTIYKETKSLKWTAAAVALPTAVGAGLCILIHLLLG